MTTLVKRGLYYIKYKVVLKISSVKLYSFQYMLQNNKPDYYDSKSLLNKKRNNESNLYELAH